MGPSQTFSPCLGQQPNAGQGRLILEASRSHTMTQATVGRIGPSQRPPPDNIQLSQDTDMHARGGIRNRNSGKRSDLRQLDHCDRQQTGYTIK
jgi:hypothetical protein